MEDFAREAMLYDFYGELLNERQREIYSAFAMEDLSLSEIAETHGISRQAVSTMVSRCRRALREYEERLHLVARFEEIREMAAKIRTLSASLPEADTAREIEGLTDLIIHEL